MILDQRVMDEIGACERSIQASLNDPGLRVVFNKIYQRWILAKKITSGVYATSDMVAGCLASPNQPMCDLQGIFVIEEDPIGDKPRGKYMYPPGCEQIIVGRMKMFFGRVGPEQVWKKIEDHNKLVDLRRKEMRREYITDVAQDCDAALRGKRSVVIP